jgi:hypothetical protein
MSLRGNQVRHQPERYPEQYARMLAVDLAFLIIVRREGERIIVIDGIHRLLKAMLQGQKRLSAGLFTSNLIPRILHQGPT